MIIPTALTVAFEPNSCTLNDMGNTWKDTTDTTRFLDADRARVVKAYDLWRERRGRSKRGSGEQSDRLFVKALKQSLDMTRSEIPTRLGVPSGRSGWSTWRKQTDKPLVKLRYDVCCAIRALTKIDVTSNGFLSATPVNSTDMVTLGPVRSVPYVCEDKETNSTSSEVIVDWVAFHLSASKVVYGGHSKKNATAHQMNQRIGSVRFALKEASIFIGNCKNPTPIAIHITSGTDTDAGKADGVNLSIDSDQSLRWRLQPPFSEDALQARFDRLRLCHTSGEQEAAVMVSISAGKEDIHPQITLDRPAELSAVEFQNTRKKLIEQVLRNRISDGGVHQRFVLSHAEAVQE